MVGTPRRLYASDCMQEKFRRKRNRPPFTACCSGGLSQTTRAAAAALSYLSPLWGGWLAEGQSGGGKNDGIGRGDPPASASGTTLRVARARPTLPRRGEIAIGQHSNRGRRKNLASISSYARAL